MYNMAVCGLLLLLLAAHNALGKDHHITKPLRIVTILEPPFVMKNAKTGKLEGIIIDVLDKVGIQIDQMDAPIHDKYGWEDNPGRFTGIVEDVADGKYDLAVAPLTIRSQRAKVVSFTQPVFNSAYLVLYKIPNNTLATGSTDTSDTLLKPFSPGLWVLIIALSLVISVVLYVIRRFNPYDNGAHSHTWQQDGDMSLATKSCGSGFMYLLGALTGRNASSTPCSTSGRILTAFWWIFSMMAVGAYVAGLAIVLSKFNPKLDSIPFSSLEEMLSGTKIKVLGVKNSPSFLYIAGHHGKYERMVYNYWKNNWNEVMMDSFEEALRKMNEGNGEYALFMNEASANYMATLEPCDKVVIGDSVGDQPIGFSCQRGSTVCDDLNHLILDLHEQGEIERLIDKWFWSKCRERPQLIFNNKKYFDTFGSKEPGLMSPHSITIHRFSAAFYILLAGLLLAGLVLMAEIFYARRSKESAHRHLTSNMRNADAQSTPDIQFSPQYTS